MRKIPSSLRRDWYNAAANDTGYLLNIKVGLTRLGVFRFAQSLRVSAKNSDIK